MLRGVVGSSSLNFEVFKVENQRQISDLFKLNDLVLVKIIDKIQGKFKITINGKLFQAEFPFDFLKGESLIAKIVKLNPITLSLDNINLVDKTVLYSLLERLNVDKNKRTVLSLEILLRINKPLSKTNIESLANFLSEFEDIEDNRAEFLAEIYFAKRDENGFDVKRYASLFRHDLKYLATKIAELAKLVENLKSMPEVKYLINQTFYLESESSSFDKNFYQKVASFKDNLKELLLKLVDYVLSDEAKGLSKDDLKTLNALIENVKSYLFQKITLESLGIYSGFIIYKDKDRERLIEYEFQKSDKSDLKNALTLNLKFDTEAFGEVKTMLTISGDNANLFFFASKEANNEFSENISELENNFCEKLSLKVKTFFKTSEQKENLKTYKRNIDVKI